MPTHRVKHLRESIEEFKSSIAEKNKLKAKDENKLENNFYKNDQRIGTSPCREKSESMIEVGFQNFDQKKTEG